MADGALDDGSLAFVIAAMPTPIPTFQAEFDVAARRVHATAAGQARAKFRATFRAVGRSISTEGA